MYVEAKKILPIQEQKLRTASEVAEALVNHAKFKSEQLLAEANRHASILVKDAEQSGLEQGQKKAFASIISGESLLNEIIENAKHIIVEIALEVAREILIQELISNPKSITARVDNLITKTLSARKIKIYVHSTIVDEVKQRTSTYPEQERIEIIGDQKLELGDVRVSTEIGEITSKIETELNEISLALVANTSRIFK